MRFLELIVLRLLLWAGLPLLLVVLAVGPRRFWRGVKHVWGWIWHSRLQPEEVLSRVLKQQEAHVAALRRVVAKSEEAEQDIANSIRRSEENINALQEEAAELAGTGDDLGARAALYKLNLERLAVDRFREHKERQRQHIADARRRLYLVELQVRQYEVGRSILLSQLAEARSLEQQYAIASHFDPFNAIAEWQRAEGLVQEKALNARAIEQVVADTTDLSLASRSTAQMDPAALDAQLAELKARLARDPVAEHSAKELSENNSRP